MTGDRLEDGLREALARRDPGPAPERLRRRLADATAAPPRVAWRWRAGRAVELAAAAAVVLAAMSLALVLRPGSGPGPGVGSAGNGDAPLVPGAGLATAAPPVLPVAIAFFLVPGVAWLVMRRIESPVGRHAAFVIAVVVAGAYGSLAGLDVVGHRDGIFATSPSRNAIGDDGDERHLVLAGPNEPFRIALTVTNVSPFPTTVRGLVPSGELQGPVPRFVGLGRLPDSVPALIEEAVAFVPVELAPGAQVDVVVLADTGPCATRPGRDVAGIVLEEVPLVTSTLGHDRTTMVRLPGGVEVPVATSCP